MKSQRPDLLVIISFVFIVGAIATSVSTGTDEQKPQTQLSQHIIR